MPFVAIFEPDAVSVPDERTFSPLALAAASIPTLPTQAARQLASGCRFDPPPRTLSCNARHQSSPEAPRAADKGSISLATRAAAPCAASLESFPSALFLARFMPSSRRPPCPARRRESRTLNWACRPRRYRCSGPARQLSATGRPPRAPRAGPQARVFCSWTAHR